MKNKNKFYLVILLIIFLSLSFISSSDFGYDNSNIPSLRPTTSTLSNESILNVNNSKYWDGYAWDIDRWLQTAGGTMAGNINMDSFNINNVLGLDANIVTTNTLDGGDSIGQLSTTTNLWDLSGAGLESDNFVSDNYCNSTDCYEVTDFLGGSGSGDGSYNITYDLWAYNQTNVAQADWLYNDGLDIYFNESKLSTIYYNATQVADVVGTIDAGSLADTQHQDGNYDGVTLNFTEDSGSPGLDLRMNFTGIDNFNLGVIRYYTSSLAGDYPVIQVWDYDKSDWEDYPLLAESETFATIEQPVFDSDDHISEGVVQMRLYKLANGNTQNHYYVDWVAIAKGYGTPAGEEVDPSSLHISKLNLTQFEYNSGFKINTTWLGEVTNSSGGGTPAGSDTQIQFNDGGSFGGDNNFTWNKTTSLLENKGQFITHRDNNSALTSVTRFGYNTGRSITYNTPAVTDGWDTTLYGYNVGNSISSGRGNLIYGANCGTQITTSDHNTLFGNYAMYYGNGNGNFALGFEALKGTSGGSPSGNIAIGSQSMRNIISPIQNLAIGYRSLYNSGTSYYNTAIGVSALTNCVGRYNVGIGYYVLPTLSSGRYATAIGYKAGNSVATAYDGTYIGSEAGYSATGTGGVYIGRSAGYYETGAHKLYIDDTDTTTPLIYGEFDNDFLQFNANVSITEDLDVVGNITAEDFITRSKYFNGNAIDLIKQIESEDSTKNGFTKINHSSLGEISVNRIVQKPIYRNEEKTTCDTVETYIPTKEIRLICIQNITTLKETCKEQLVDIHHLENVTTCKTKTIPVVDHYEEIIEEGQSVDKTIALLIKTNQELIERVEQLETRVNLLENPK